MSTRFLAIAYTVLAVGLVGVVPGAAGQTDTSGSNDWTVPRAPDGHPDLQGVWPNNGATPLERPEVLGDRAYLTEEEVSTLQARASELFNGETDAAFGGSVFETVLQDANDYQSGDGVTTETPDGTGNYNQFWLVDREFDNRTSLIVDPPNGRLPARTAGAVQLAEAERALRRAHPADSYSDRNVDDRCISYGVPRTSAGYNSYFQNPTDADPRGDPPGDDPRGSPHSTDGAAPSSDADPSIHRRLAGPLGRRQSGGWRRRTSRPRATSEAPPSVSRRSSGSPEWRPTGSTGR